MTEEIEKETEETVIVPSGESLEDPDENQPAEISEEIVESPEDTTEMERLRKDNDNYKRELAIFRKPNTAKLRTEISQTHSPETKSLETDYLSKSADVMDELEGEFQSLTPAQFKRIEPLIVPTMRATFDEAVKKESYVARGKLKAVVSELISFVRGPYKPIETIDQEKLESAEITAVRPPANRQVARTTEKDQALAEQTGTDVAIITANRLAKEKREADFNKTVKHV